MARTGVYFSDVKKARDKLVAQGRHPSIDAVRAALGDTGSKTTIHKFLRELDVEENAPERNVSDAILTLAKQLGEQLKQEAGVELEAVRDEMAELRAAHLVQMAEMEKKLADSRLAHDDVARQLSASLAESAKLQDQLHAQQIARHTAEQHSIDLGARLADAQQHQTSLEDKHRQAREALEHFRTAAREQRDQETRRHAHQLQGVQVELRDARLAAAMKQEETTRLNKEAAALVAEVAAGKQAAFLDRENIRHLTRQMTRLQAAETRVDVLGAQLADSQARIAAFEEAAGKAAAINEALRQQNAALEVQVANAASTNELTNALAERLAKLDQAVFGITSVDDSQE
jgi:chromosome segregation ATPase